MTPKLCRPRCSCLSKARTSPPARPDPTALRYTPTGVRSVLGGADPVLLRHHHDARGAPEGWWRPGIAVEARQHSLRWHGRLLHVLQRYPAGDGRERECRFFFVTIFFQLSRAKWSLHFETAAQPFEDCSLVFGISQVNFFK